LNEEKFRKELSNQLKSINERQEKLEIEFSKLIDKITITGEIPKSSIPAQKLLELFTESLNKTQQDIAAAPGTAKFSLGSFSPNVKATITFDEEDGLILNLPQPGDPTPPEVLSNIAFNVLPLPWEPSIAADEIMVPTLVGLPFDLAKSKIEESGLVLGEVIKESTEIPSKIVLKQDPAAGLILLKGGKINLTISENIFVEIPLVVGLHIDDAKKVLEDMGLGNELRSEIESDQPVGQVLNQEPLAAEKVRKETVVMLDISKGKPNQVHAPDLIGKNLEDAKHVITNSDLEVGEINELESEALSGIIIQQNPSAGAVMVKKSKVNLIVSKGLLVEVPSVFGLQYNNANEVLKSIDLIAKVRSEIGSNQPPGEVLNQDPTVGKRVEKQSTVGAVKKGAVKKGAVKKGAVKKGAVKKGAVKKGARNK